MTLPVSLSTHSLEAGLDLAFTRFETAFAEATHHKSYDVAQTPFVVASQHGSYLDATDRAWTSVGKGTGAPCRIVVGVQGQHGLPTLHWADPYFEERQVEAALAQSRYRLHYFHDRGFWQIFDRNTGQGMQIMVSEDGYPDWDPGSPLRNFVQWRLAENGGALIHAGTLAAGDKGVLLVGAGGSGKSGTVLAGVLNGLQTVGDDYVFVTTRTMEAFALFDTLKQDAAGLARLNLASHPAIPQATNWQNKHQFYLPDLAPKACQDKITLKALLLPTISGTTATHFVPTSAKEGFLALAPSGVSQIPGDRPVLYKVAAEVARRLPCYRLNLGTDPAEIAQAIRQFIDES